MTRNFVGLFVVLSYRDGNIEIVRYEKKSAIYIQPTGFFEQVGKVK